MSAEIQILVIGVPAVVAALVALWTSKENHKAVRAVSKMTEGQLLLDLLKEYSSDLMLESVQALKNWKINYKDAYKTEFKERYKMKDLSVFPVIRARQNMLRYFIRMLQLYNAGYISEASCKIICNQLGTEVLFEVVEPFEEIVSQIEPDKITYDKATFDNLRRLCNIEPTNNALKTH